jgi:hypothetical protein
MSATAAISGVLSTPDTTQKQLFIDFTVTLTGNYGGGATHGDTLNLQSLGDALKSTQLPNWVEFGEYPPSGTAPTGYLFGYAPGTTQANGVFTIFNNLTEYTQGSAYSAGLLAAVIRGRAWFPSEI